MQTTTRSNFTTIKTEGAILPADLLQRIHEGTVDGLRPQDYHLAPSERLSDAISRSWSRLRGVWQSFSDARQALSEADRGTSLTRERWLLILFEELGYGRLPYRGGLAVDGEDGDGARYPISHEVEGVPIHLVTFRQALDRADGERAEGFRRSPHSLLQEFLNRAGDALWGFVSNGLQLRVLRDNASLTRAAYLEFDLEAMMTGELFADFSLLWLIAHQSRVERQIIERPKATKKAGKKPAATEEQPEEGDEEESVVLPRKPTAADCWLERWSADSAAQGTRALDSLRDGVQKAIEALGAGFLAHPANTALRDQLQSGALAGNAYYRQLLRLVYRLIFLLVAEDRDLLLSPEATAEARQRYRDFYSLGRLRALAALRRGGAHPDLYRGLRLVIALLRDGYGPLGLPALGGFLFAERAAPDLDAAELSNEALLDALRELAFTVEGRVLRPVDYRNLGAEELGSVYESLLELHPELNVAAATFALRAAAGSERKTTGSYYTPTSLITSLLDTALEPVVEDRLRGKKGAEAEAALLAIKVVDPAAGSGHFLIAAANRLARHLAAIRTGDAEPDPAARRAALRDVVRHCIHGVDSNEMAVELCKVGLWLETLDPGKPLSFLDANIQCGNSLIGATPALLAAGIPDEAFETITGDDKAYAREWKKRNAKERDQQVMAFGEEPWQRLGDLAAAMARLDALSDGTLADVRAQERAYVELVRSSAYEYGRLWADAWCAAFVWPLRGEERGGFPYPITEGVLRRIERNPFDLAPWMRAEIVRLREQYQFFHWHLAFPQVFGASQTSEVGEREFAETSEVSGWAGGFDVVMGNPPWERIKLQEKEWFAGRDAAIATAPNAAARGRLIAALPKENPPLHAAFQEAKRRAEGESAFVRHSGRYPLCGRGNVNTYTLFAELCRHLPAERGRAGIIVPSGIATDDTTKFFFQDIVETGALASLYDFENRNAIFPGVHRSYKFCLLTLRGSGNGEQEAGAPYSLLPDPHSPSPAEFIFFALRVEDLKDEQRRFTLSAEEIALLNPNTRTCPIFRTRRDAELTKGIYRRVPVLIREEYSPEGKVTSRQSDWNCEITRTFDMARFSQYALAYQSLVDIGLQQMRGYFTGDSTWIPVLESKTFWHFDHRAASYAGVPDEEAKKGNAIEVSQAVKLNPHEVVLARYWLPEDKVKAYTHWHSEEYWVAYRNITNTTNERTTVASILPRRSSDYTVRLIFGGEVKGIGASCLLANLNSYVFDYISRQSMGGTNFSDYIMKQLPLLPPTTYHHPCTWHNHASRRELSRAHATLHEWLLPRVLELTYTAYDLRPFAQNCGYDGPPFRWDETRRFLLRCELDAAYFHLYGIARDDVAYIMDTFNGVRKKDETAHGEYRTKRVILEVYDAMAEAIRNYELGIRNGEGYRTRLDPPPADPRAAHPWDEEYLGPELPVEAWWREVDSGQWPVASEEGAATVLREPSPGYQTSRATGGGPPLELRSPPVAGKPVGKPATRPRPAPQPALPLVAPIAPAPAGPRSARLRRAMELGRDGSAAATAELVAFLADEDDSIRWLAGSSLAQREGAAGVVAAIAHFVRGAEAERVAAARGEMRRVLEMIMDAAEGEGVREAAQSLLAELADA